MHVPHIAKREIRSTSPVQSLPGITWAAHRPALRSSSGADNNTRWRITCPSAALPSSAGLQRDNHGSGLVVLNDPSRASKCNREPRLCPAAAITLGVQLVTGQRGRGETLRSRAIDMDGLHLPNRPTVSITIGLPTSHRCPCRDPQPL